MKKYAVIIAALICCVWLVAQTTTGLVPPPKFQGLDNSGKPLSGGLVYTYSAGTTTPLATYTDSTGGTPNANPVVLDSAGRANIWLSSSTYKIVLKNSAGVTIWTVDGITAPTLSSGSVTISSGHALTLQSGSTTSFSTDILPGAANTYKLGASGNAFLSAFINALTVNGNMTMGTGNTYDIFGSAAPARNLYAASAYHNITGICGLTAGVLSNPNCYSLTGTSDVNNRYMTVKDDAGTEVWRWSRVEGGVGTNVATTSLTILPSTDNTLSLGSVSQRFNDINMAGDLEITDTAGGMRIGGGFDNRGYLKIPHYTLASIGTAVTGVGSLIWCTNCLAGSTPCSAGPPNGALAAYNPSSGQWECK
jgi:hypothetical protein